jgi:uncharacterized membrane protein
MTNISLFLQKFRNHKEITLTAFFFLLLYCSIALVNHYNFRTYALDLGTYVNVVYNYAHFNFASNQVWQAQSVNILGDHFDLFLMIISPLSYIFHNYTLQLVQIIFIIIGGIGIYQFCNMLFENKKIALIISISFFSFYGVFAALAFDYHSNVVAAMLVPWFFYYFFQSRWLNCNIIFLLILITKENMSLWLAFIALGLIVHFKHDKSKIKRASIYGAIAITWFILLVKIIMPALFDKAIYAHMHYEVLGSGFTEIIKNSITTPLHFFSLLFINHSGNAHADWIKTELHLFILISGGFLLLFKPQFLLMLVPIYAQKLFHNDVTVWGISSQYSIEFAPVLFLGAACVINDVKHLTTRKILLFLLPVLTVAVTIRSFDHTYAYFDRTKQRIYQPEHWTRNFDVPQAYLALNLIPINTVVSAQSPFVPHLAERKHIYQYPIINDAGYIILNINENSYPLLLKEYNKKIIELINSKNWNIVYKQPPVIIFKHN